MDVTTREAKLLMQSHAGKFVVWIKQGSNGYWVVEIHVEKRVHHLATTRGATKGWRQLADSISFVQRHCTDFRDCFVAIGGWVLRQSEVTNHVEGVINE